MIGFYNYTVVLTYMSLVSAIMGIAFSTNGHFRLAMVCLALSGFFDMFDGKVARRKLDRTDNEKLFGIQLDSLCDVVAFGVFPAIFCFCFGMRGTFGVIIILAYAICGVIRLAYFNVLETNQFFSDEEAGSKVYHGLPITSISVILPIVFLLNYVISTNLFYILLHVTMLVTGGMFVADFEMKKPSNKVLFILVAIVAAAIIFALTMNKYSRIYGPVMY